MRTVKFFLWVALAWLGEIVSGISTLGLFVAFAVNAWIMVPCGFGVIGGVALRNWGLDRSLDIYLPRR